VRTTIVFGGYGTFGRQVCRELAKGGAPLLVAGRNRGRAEAFAEELGLPRQARVADVRDAGACRRVLPREGVAVCCAGPFSRMSDALLRACHEAGCHYVDIAEDRAYIATVRSWAGRFRERGLCAVFGASSLPGLSSALALLAREGADSDPQRVRVTLLIGNRNPKGGAAVRTVVDRLGRPIQTPHGMLRSFHGGEVVTLPAPFGRRAAFNFESADYDLLHSLVGAGQISVKVAFELRLGTRLFAFLAHLPLRYGRVTAGLVSALGAPLRAIGHSGGAILAELFWADGRVRRASLAAPHDGQRMAALPAALSALTLARSAASTGAMLPHQLLGLRPLVSALSAEGFEVARAGDT
jgi:saccharopine dehydrogenase-like protein